MKKTVRQSIDDVVEEFNSNSRIGEKFVEIDYMKDQIRKIARQRLKSGDYAYTKQAMQVFSYVNGARDEGFTYVSKDKAKDEWQDLEAELGRDLRPCIYRKKHLRGVIKYAYKDWIPY